MFALHKSYIRAKLYPFQPTLHYITEMAEVLLVQFFGVFLPSVKVQLFLLALHILYQSLSLKTDIFHIDWHYSNVIKLLTMVQRVLHKLSIRFLLADRMIVLFCNTNGRFSNTAFNTVQSFSYINKGSYMSLALTFIKWV